MGPAKRSVDWEKKTVESVDLVLIGTNHACVNYQELARWARCTVDTRNAMPRSETSWFTGWKQLPSRQPRARLNFFVNIYGPPILRDGTVLQLPGLLSRSRSRVVLVVFVPASFIEKGGHSSSGCPDPTLFAPLAHLGKEALIDCTGLPKRPCQ
jgi:hypothetical protein